MTRLITGLVATADVRDDLLQVNIKERQECLQKIPEVQVMQLLFFFDLLNKLMLKSFKDLKTVIKIRAKNSVFPIRLDRDIFARMALIGQFRKIDM